MEILGVSLTTWLVVLGVFVIITPIVGKQVAKDALRVKDSLRSPAHSIISSILFPNESSVGSDTVQSRAPIQKFTEEKYTRLMMMGGVWIKFLYNIGVTILRALQVMFESIIYLIGAFFRGTFFVK